MAQRTKKIALDRTYLPIDPNSLPVTMHDTGGEDKPEDRIPVVPFEGWNFMPTGYGWRSYFGIASSLDIDPLFLPARCRDIFIFQKTDLSNFLVALCDTGIWTKQGESSGAWTQAVTLTDPDDGTLLEWSSCIIENDLYVYRQGEASAYVCSAPSFAFTAHTPNTLNMAGQLGIFKAGGRLGFWDSADAVGYSALVDKADFVPSVSTLANITTIRDLIGKIVNVVQHGDGFIIYATKSIIGVQKDLSNTFLWRTKVISNVAGIAYRRQVAVGSPDTEHYAWTSIGLMRIRNFEPELVAPELFDFLKEAQDPIYLKVLEGRYLAVQIANSAYVDGIVSFYTQTIEQQTITLSDAQELFQLFPNPALVTSITSSEGSFFFFGLGAYKGKNTDSTFKDYFSLPIDSAPSLAPLARGEKGETWDPSVFNWTRLPLLPAVGAVPAINGLSEVSPLAVTRVKEGATPLSSYSYKTPAHVASPEIDIVEIDNSNNFFARTKEIWDRYEAFRSSWQSAVSDRFANDINPALDVIHPAYVPCVFSIVDKDGTAGSDASLQAVTALTGTDSPLYSQPMRNLEIELPANFVHEWGIVESGGDDYAFHIARPATSTTYTWTQSLNTMVPLGPFIVRCTGGRASSANPQSQSLVGLSGIPDVTIDVADFNALTTPLLAAAIEDIIAAIVAAVPEFASGTTHSWWPADTTAADATYGMSQASLGNPSYAYRKVDQLHTQADTTGLTLTTKTITNVQTGAQIAAFSAASLDIYAQNNEAGGAFRDGIFNIQILGRPRTKEVFTLTTDFNFVVDPCDATLSYVSYAKRSADVVNGQDVIDTHSQCAIYDPNRNFDNFMGLAVDPPGIVPSIEWLDQDFINRLYYPEVTFTFPGASFSMQVGTPAPYLIEWKGAYVYDTQLKRWGKMKNEYYQLLDFSPINSTALGTIPYTIFGVKAAMLATDGLVKVFDANPADSYLKFGKYGNFRHGYTSLEMIKANFRQPCTGKLVVESSINGNAVELSTITEYDYTDATQIVQGHSQSARWHNVGFKGQFDLSYLELTSWSASRR